MTMVGGGDDGGFLSFCYFRIFFMLFLLFVSISSIFLLQPLSRFSLLAAFLLPFAGDLFPLDWSRLVPGTPLAFVCVSYSWSSASVSYVLVRLLRSLFVATVTKYTPFYFFHKNLFFFLAKRNIFFVASASI